MHGQHFVSTGNNIISIDDDERRRGIPATLQALVNGTTETRSTLSETTTDTLIIQVSLGVVNNGVNTCAYRRYLMVRHTGG